MELHFTNEALGAIAREAMTRNTGARGLRTIIEEIMLEIMYEIPSRGDIRRVLVNEDAVLRRSGPILLTSSDVQDQAQQPAS